MGTAGDKERSLRRRPLETTLNYLQAPSILAGSKANFTKNSSDRNDRNTKRGPELKPTPYHFLIYIVCIAYQLFSLNLNYKMTTIYLGRAGANVATLKAHLKNGRTCMKLSPVDISLLLESTSGGNTQQSKCSQSTAVEKNRKSHYR